MRVLTRLRRVFFIAIPTKQTVLLNSSTGLPTSAFGLARFTGLVRWANGRSFNIAINMSANGVREAKQRDSPEIGLRHCRLDFSHRCLVQDETFGRLTSWQLHRRLLGLGIWPLLRVRLCALVVPPSR